MSGLVNNLYLYSNNNKYGWFNRSTEWLFPVKLHYLKLKISDIMQSKRKDNPRKDYAIQLKVIAGLTGLKLQKNYLIAL